MALTTWDNENFDYPCSQKIRIQFHVELCRKLMGCWRTGKKRQTGKVIILDLFSEQNLVNLFHPRWRRGMEAAEISSSSEPTRLGFLAGNSNQGTTLRLRKPETLPVDLKSSARRISLHRFNCRQAEISIWASTGPGALRAIVKRVTIRHLRLRSLQLWSVASLSNGHNMSDKKKKKKLLLCGKWKSDFFFLGHSGNEILQTRSLQASWFFSLMQHSLHLFSVWNIVVGLEMWFFHSWVWRKPKTRGAYESPECFLAQTVCLSRFSSPSLLFKSVPILPLHITKAACSCPSER